MYKTVDSPSSGCPISTWIDSRENPEMFSEEGID